MNKRRRIIFGLGVVWILCPIFEDGTTATIASIFGLIVTILGLFEVGLMISEELKKQ